MTTDEIEQALLLRQSGECPPERLAELERALQASPEAAALATELDGILQAAEQAFTVSATPDWTRERILHEAARQEAPAKTGKRVLWSALAAAAVALIAVGIQFNGTVSSSSAGTAVIAQQDAAPLSDISMEVLNEDPLLDSLAFLEQELASLGQPLESADWLEVGDPESWATELLAWETQI